MMSGDIKNILIDLLHKIASEHQKNRLLITNEIMNKVFSVRKMI